ncbi:sugar ABC transporter permease [Bifidobacterium sp. SO1]|uniref:carbohydrate ABC transporter permease n=1 Tax=Bifidobacterium sp. SO1 TaxID=2809029 RepID=UPI001F0A4DFB|nr:sugar ABC transporter permease [Bifidobacterium sp. SO1]
MTTATVLAAASNRAAAPVRALDSDLEAAHAKDRRHRNLMENLTSVQFLLPLLAVYIIIVLIPFAQSIVFSLTDYDGYDFANASFVGLANYRTIFADQTLLAGLGFTMLYTIATTVLITAIALPLAVTLNRKFFGRNFARSLFFFFSVPSMAVLGLVWQYIFSPLGTGAVNTLLGKLGIAPVPWLSDPTLAKGCVIFIAVWAQIGWHATLYLAYLQAIPADLYEQASVDGASRGQQFAYITLPQMVPAMGVSIFMLLTGGLKVYDLPFTLTTGGPGHATYTVTQSIIVTGIGSGRYGVGSALGVMFFLCCVILVALQQVVTNGIEKRLS